jgi:hypothetical protein
MAATVEADVTLRPSAPQPRAEAAMPTGPIVHVLSYQNDLDFPKIAKMPMLCNIRNPSLQAVFAFTIIYSYLCKGSKCLLHTEQSSA